MIPLQSVVKKEGAIAIMTDTYNTKESAIAWYGPIKILKNNNNGR